MSCCTSDTPTWALGAPTPHLPSARSPRLLVLLPPAHLCCQAAPLLYLYKKCSIDLQTFFHNSLKGFQEILKPWGKNNLLLISRQSRSFFCNPVNNIHITVTLIELFYAKRPLGKKSPPAHQANSCGSLLPRLELVPHPRARGPMETAPAPGKLASGKRPCAFSCRRAERSYRAGMRFLEQILYFFFLITIFSARTVLSASHTSAASAALNTKGNALFHRTK